MNYAQLVEDAWTEHTRAEKSRAPGGGRSYVYASGWKSCRRAMALDLLHPEDAQFSDDSLERFIAGDAFERAVRAHLIHAGQYAAPSFEVEGGQQRFEIKDRSGRVIIVGKIDGFLKFKDGRRIVWETKAGVSVANVNTLDDMERGRWTRPMLRQILSYMLGLSVENGLLILNRPGRPRFLPIELDGDGMEKAEDFLARAELAVDVVEGKADLPDYTLNRGDCERCDHRGRSCTPPVDFGEGLRVIDDARLIALARQRDENAEAAAAFNQADRALKSDLRGLPLVHLGRSYEVRGKWQKRTTYTVPAEVREQYKEVDDQGAWKMTIEKIGEEPSLEDQLAASVAAAAERSTR